jgi:F-type H+-transporting ATPase subunit c
MRKKLTWLVGTMVLALLGPSMALAQEGGANASDGYIALAAGLGIGIAAVGAGLGQGRAVAAAMESIGRNPNAADRIQTPMIIGIAFMEALAIYALVIAFFLQESITEKHCNARGGTRVLPFFAGIRHGIRGLNEFEQRTLNPCSRLSILCANPILLLLVVFAHSGVSCRQMGERSA